MNVPPDWKTVTKESGMHTHLKRTKSNLTLKSNAELLTLQQQSKDVLSALVEALENRSDMQGALQLLMQPEDMLETFSRLGVEDPDLARLTLEAGIAALVNTQNLKAVEAELKTRRERN